MKFKEFWYGYFEPRLVILNQLILIGLVMSDQSQYVRHLAWSKVHMVKVKSEFSQESTKHEFSVHLITRSALVLGQGKF